MLLSFVNRECVGDELYKHMKIRSKNISEVPVYDTDDATCETISPKELRSLILNKELHIDNIKVYDKTSICEYEIPDFKVDIPNTGITILRFRNSTLNMGILVSFIGNDYVMAYHVGNTTSMAGNRMYASIIPPIYDNGEYYIKTYIVRGCNFVPCSYEHYKSSKIVIHSEGVKSTFTRILALKGTVPATEFLRSLGMVVVP